MHTICVLFGEGCHTNNNIKSWGKIDIVNSGLITNTYMWSRVTSLSVSFYILNICVLLVLRLFMMNCCFFNHVEETFKLSVNLLISACQFLPGGLIVMMFWTGFGLNKWTKSFTIVNKYFINTYVQFLFTKRACDKRLCIIVPCISEKWEHQDILSHILI